MPTDYKGIATLGDSVGGAVANIGGLFSNQSNMAQLKWYQNAMANFMNQNHDAKQLGQDTAFNSKDDLYNRLMPYLDNQFQNNNTNRNQLNGLQGDSFNLDSIYNPMNFYGRSPQDMGLTPEKQAAIDALGGQAGRYNTTGDLAQKGFQGGGWSNQSQRTFDGLDKFMDPNGLNAKNSQMGDSIIEGGGWSPFAGRLQDAGTQSLDRGGATSQSQGLAQSGSEGLGRNGLSQFDQLYLQAAKQGLGTQGFNGNSNALSNAGQGILGTGGKNADNSFLTSRGNQILSRDPLLSMDEATSRAADQASSMFADSSKQNYRQAMNRGGGPGVRSGLQNEAVDEGQDKQLRAVGDAITNARAQQQGLQLQQFGQGANLSSSGLQNQLAQMGLGGSLTGQGEQAALARMLGLTGLGSDASNRGVNASNMYGNMLQNSGQLENQNQQILGGLGAQGTGLANQKLGMGINLLQNTQGNELGALGQYNNTLGTQNQYALGLGGLSNAAYGGASNAFNSQFGNNQASDQFGFGRQQAQYGGFQQNFQNAQNNYNNQTGQYLEGLKPIQNTQNQGYNMYNNALNQNNSLFNSYNTNKALGTNAYGKAAGGVATLGTDASLAGG